MKLAPYRPPNNTNFIGRISERKELNEIEALPNAKMLIVYGRRRVGKTELIEQTYRNRLLIKFEGLETGSKIEQIQHCVETLERQLKVAKGTFNSIATWRAFFELLDTVIDERGWILYFEEVQWLARYHSSFAADLKYVWDNKFRHHKKLLLVLCGSSPSFMLGKLIRSKALYNRAQHVMHVQPFSLRETHQFLGEKTSLEEVLDAYLCVGGIPEYLSYLKRDNSVYLSLLRACFSSNGFFYHEFEKVFVSSLGENPFYRGIVEYLSKRPHATRPQIETSLGLSSGGGSSSLLKDLELCGFISQYSPLDVKENSKLSRYSVADNYLALFYKFIKPELRNIEARKYDSDPIPALNLETLRKWLGLAFERYCRANAHLIAKQLGFSGIKYSSGALYNRSSNLGFQLDLCFDRADRTLTVCEIKYSEKINIKGFASELNGKLELLKSKRRTLHKVLILGRKPENTPSIAGHFDALVTVEELV